MSIDYGHKASVEAQLWTNHEDEEAWPVEPFESEDGLVDVERSGDDEISIHLRHINNISVTFSAYMTKAQALQLGFALVKESLQ